MNKQSHFSEWLKGELRKRGWSQTELAQRSGLSRSMISFLLSGQREPSANTCRYLARALDLAPEKVLREADLLPEGRAPDNDPTLNELIDIMKRMSQQEREEILDYALWRFQRRREE